MRILVSGSSGLIGSALLRSLSAAGHTAVRLVRATRTPAAGDVAWDPAGGHIENTSLEGFDAVVHLAGESIAGGRWTAQRKQCISDSRITSTRLLSQSLAGLNRPPGVLIAASAVGFYGDRGDELLTESSPAGSGFLAEICKQWEAASQLGARRGIRVVNLRFGMVLAAHGGALATMLPAFRLGLGGPLGPGNQWVSWIALDDVLGVIEHAIADERLRGPVNTVAPAAVTNREFGRTLGRVLDRPAVLTLPAFVLRLALGELADALLLASDRVCPQRLQASGYRFLHPDLEPALRHVLRPDPQRKRIAGDLRSV
ncbi:MAG TPA: TIGR01777 family oxidoreductase [Terriglobia bacterium]|nr:TIGR01777 family oxidoreductase [Terriglobia bacterium]